MCASDMLNLGAYLGKLGSNLACIIPLYSISEVMWCGVVVVVKSC